MVYSRAQGATIVVFTMIVKHRSITAGIPGLEIDHDIVVTKACRGRITRSKSLFIGKVVFPPGNTILILGGAHEVHISVAIQIKRCYKISICKRTVYLVFREVFIAVVFIPVYLIIFIGRSGYIHISITVNISGGNIAGMCKITCNYMYRTEITAAIIGPPVNRINFIPCPNNIEGVVPINIR